MFTAAECEMIKSNVFSLVGFSWDGDIRVDEGKGLTVEAEKDRALIAAESKTALARAYFRLAQEKNAGKEAFRIHEEPRFESCGAFLDFSRNDVINKVFPHSLFGYDPIAVDAFLDEVIREFDRLNNTIDVLQFRIAHELGDAYHQNDCLSRELEFAQYGRRIRELLASPSGEVVLSADAHAESEEDGEVPSDPE